MIYPVSNVPVAKEKKHFYVDDSKGGWGGLTLGILTPVSLAKKSFGMYYYGTGDD